MVVLRIILMTLLGGMIGWITNKIALTSLFRPYEKKRFLGLFYHQGLLPKNQKNIARDIGKVVSEELVNVEDIVDEVLRKKKKANSMGSFSEDFERKFPFFEKLSPKKNIIKLFKKLLSEIDIAKIVEGKISKLSMAEMEEMIVNIVKKEMRHIELFGGVLGLVIGFIQGIITIVV